MLAPPKEPSPERAPWHVPDNLLGWVHGEPVFAAADDARVVELATSYAGARLGFDPSLITTCGTDGSSPDGITRRSALRFWSARVLLVNQLAKVEAERLGVSDLTSPDDWADRLEGAGELGAQRPTEAEALCCYRANIYRYQLPEMRRARHVLLVDYEIASALAGQVTNAVDLAATARQYSLDHGTRPGGGDLGWVRRGELDGPLEAAIFAASPGRIYGPVQSQFGWHLLVVEEVRPALVRPFAACRDEIFAEIWHDRRRSAWQFWWQRRVAEAITVPPGAEAVLLPGLAGTSHRH